MRKILLAAAGFAVLAGGAGLAIAQNNAAPGEDRPARHDIFQADSNNDGVLTRQEFDAGRNAMFARQDVNNDGQLTRDEMHRGGHGGRHHGGRDGGMHSMRSADANNDGNITRDEFLARPLEHFNRMDTNHDGVIQASERPQRGDHDANDGHGGRRGGDRPRMDSNDDHQISRAEFAAMSTSMFDRMDANHDGRVTRAEADAARPQRHHGD